MTKDEKELFDKYRAALAFVALAAGGKTRVRIADIPLGMLNIKVSFLPGGEFMEISTKGITKQ